MHLVCTTNSSPSCLGGDASVDPLVKGTLLRELGGEVVLVLLEHLLIVGGESLNLVNVRHLTSDERGSGMKQSDQDE